MCFLSKHDHIPTLRRADRTYDKLAGMDRIESQHLVAEDGDPAFLVAAPSPVSLFGSRRLDDALIHPAAIIKKYKRHPCRLPFWVKRQGLRLGGLRPALPDARRQRAAGEGRRERRALGKTRADSTADQQQHRVDFHQAETRRGKPSLGRGDQRRTLTES